jgi:hypothetical protein
VGKFFGRPRKSSQLLNFEKLEFFSKMQLSHSVFSFMALSIFIAPNMAQGSASATAPSPQASAACLEISTGSAETQIWPAGLTNADYEDAKNHYYSAANADLTRLVLYSQPQLQKFLSSSKFS